ncbi:hypothetical protein L7F22_049675 [Adiantum nelumboides]|nr:hypothetical protein [Adiantum nelumboides]
MDSSKLQAKKQRWAAFQSSSAPSNLRRRMTKTLDHLEAPKETPIYIVDDVRKKNLFGPSSLTELDTVYNIVVSKHSFALSEYNEAFKKLELLQEDVHQNEGANLLVDKLRGQLKDADAALLKAEDSINVVDAMHVEELKNTIDKLSLDTPNIAKAKPDAKVEIVGGYNCEEQDPKLEVHVEKEGVLEKDSLENGDQAENCPSMKDNKVSVTDTSPSILQIIQMIQRERKRRMTDGATEKPTEDVGGQTKTLKDQVEKETGENSNMESGRKDATTTRMLATSNIDNLDHIISEDTEIIIKKSEPPQETGDAPMEAGGDASCAGGVVGASGAGEDMEIINEKSEPPQGNGDAPVDASVDASGDAICVGGAIGASGAGEDTAEPPHALLFDYHHPYRERQCTLIMTCILNHNSISILCLVLV